MPYKVIRDLVCIWKRGVPEGSGCPSPTGRRMAPMGISIQSAQRMSCASPGKVRELRNVADRFVLGPLGETLIAMTIDGHEGGGLPARMEQIEHVTFKSRWSSAARSGVSPLTTPKTIG